MAPDPSDTKRTGTGERAPGATGPIPARPVTSLLVPLLAPDADEARRLLEEELGKAAYADARPNVFERIVAEILRGIGGFLDGLTGLGAGPGTVVLAVGAVLVILLAVLLVRPRGNARGRTEEPTVFEDGRRSAAEHRGNAAAAAAAGDWNSSVAETLRATIRTAEERVVLDEQLGRTATEAGMQLGAAFPALRTEIRWLTELFDETRYGSGQATAEDHTRATTVDASVSGERPTRSRDATVPAAPR